MPDFMDPARKRQERIEELQDDIDRKRRELYQTQDALKQLQRKQELLDAEVADMEEEIDRQRREDERLRVMESMDLE